MLAAFLLRAAVALGSDNRLNADEIFQYLEQAHRLAFGYGVVPWEYRFGTRSWIIPGFVAGVLSACRQVGLDRPELYVAVVKIVFCLIAVSIVPSLYAIGRALFSEQAGRAAALGAALWYELVFYAHKPIPDALSCYCCFGALALALGNPQRWRGLSVGVLGAMAVALRMQSLPLAAVVALVAVTRWPRRALVPAALGCLAVVIAAGLLDRFAWGSWFASYVNNWRFNAVYGVASLFGEQPASYYGFTLLVTSFGLAAPGLLGLLLAGRRAWPLWGGAGVTLLSYSMVAHKEHRFVFAIIPMWLLGFAATVDWLAARAPRVRTPALLIGAVVSGLGLLGRLPLESYVYRRPPLSSESTLLAYRMLAREPQLTAVSDATGAWLTTGGYYYLHRDVPVYFDTPAPAADASHLLRPEGPAPVPGFALEQRIGSVEIWRRTSAPPQQRPLPGYTRYPPQPGIDGRFVPTVTPRW